MIIENKIAISFWVVVGICGVIFAFIVGGK